MINRKTDYISDTFVLSENSFFNIHDTFLVCALRIYNDEMGNLIYNMTPTFFSIFIILNLDFCPMIFLYNTKKSKVEPIST